MPENIKIATLNQEVNRRMINKSKDLDVAIRLEVLDDFAQKIVNSGYGLQQTKNIMLGGLKGYECKLKLSLDTTNPKWHPLHPPAKYNITARRRKKILEKNNWFKKPTKMRIFPASRRILPPLWNERLDLEMMMMNSDRRRVLSKDSEGAGHYKQ